MYGSLEEEFGEKRRSILMKVILFIIMIICFFSESLRQITGIPLVHIGNGIIILMFFFLVISKKVKKLWQSSDMLLILACGLAFIIFSSIIGIVYGVRPILFLWSLRRYLVFYCLLADCYLVFDNADIHLFYKLLDAVIVIHIVLTLVQFFIFGVRWDYLNGIFGTMMGGNAGVNILFIVNTGLCFYRFYKRKMQWWLLLTHIAWMCCNAFLSEIKVYVIELVVAMIIYVVVTREYKRVLKILLPILAMMYVSILLMYYIYPYYSDYYSLLFLNLMSTLSEPHHSNPDSLSRLNQISGLIRPIMEYAKIHRFYLEKLAPIIGLGLGNAELSTNGLFDSEFYLTNIRLWYWDFVLSMVYVEGGAVGLFLYSFAWVFIPVKATIQAINKKSGSNLLIILTCAMVLFIMIYDVSLRNNYGYMIWAFVGIVYAVTAKENDHK